ncbi:MAG: hypothetical protein JSV80_06570, partial [Acidobacteriota bacterium]
RRVARELDLHGELFDVYLELWRLARREHDSSASRACLRSLRHLARYLEVFPPHADDLRRALDAESRRCERDVG